MRKIIESAVEDQRAHFKIGAPITEGQGLKEANIASTISYAFRRAGYYAYPEIRFDHGSIDAVFVRKNEAVVCEWKQLYPESMSIIVEQTNRMRSFATQIQSTKHGFKIPIRKLRLLWVCDTWEPKLKDWWFGRKDKRAKNWPFDKWSRGKAEFESFGDGWSPYSWLWAYTNRANQTLKPTRITRGST